MWVHLHLFHFFFNFLRQKAEIFQMDGQAWTRIQRVPLLIYRNALEYRVHQQILSQQKFRGRQVFLDVLLEYKSSVLATAGRGLNLIRLPRLFAAWQEICFLLPVLSLNCHCQIKQPKNNPKNNNSAWHVTCAGVTKLLIWPTCTIQIKRHEI